jgi:hypothetical protein
MVLDDKHSHRTDRASAQAWSVEALFRDAACTNGSYVNGCALHRDMGPKCDLNHERADRRGQPRRIQNPDGARGCLDDSLESQVS